MTAAVADSARSVAGLGTEIVALPPTVGAESVEGNSESHLAAVAVMSAVVTCDGPFDAVVAAGFGEHGSEGLQELLDVPVVDIAVGYYLVARGRLPILPGDQLRVVRPSDERAAPA